ncbi:hypothetical protein WJX72_009326 [[Myrmecia] bisecta]|uniref:NADH dehydrogenase [ubiquinone] 1 beta subcomplex subunit 11, mitochondrial n=1 Tax=[Myrmecia] bisecta TaxID=41462 RepID=A0AAW1Q632_9CHLO
MQFLRRLPTGALRNFKPRGGDAHAKGGFWSEGTQEKAPGYIFNETPPPPGQARKWEAWEAPWYATFLAAGLLLAIGLPSRPESSMVHFAHKKAKQELAEEGL